MIRVNINNKMFLFQKLRVQQGRGGVLNYVLLGLENHGFTYRVDSSRKRPSLTVINVLSFR